MMWTPQLSKHEWFISKDIWRIFNSKGLKDFSSNSSQSQKGEGKKRKEMKKEKKEAREERSKEGRKQGKRDIGRGMRGWYLNSAREDEKKGGTGER
jgi:hypothetical protein